MQVIRKNKSTNFYNRFHKHTNLQKKIISENNFTYKIVLTIINKYLKGHKLSILDYGCGAGTVSLFLANKGNSVTGIDISDKAIKYARKSAKQINLSKLAKFYNLNTGLSTIKDKNFDIILCIEVIEHIKDDMKLVSFFQRKLKKNGILILSTPSMNAPLYKFGLSDNFDKRVGHLRRYKTDDLIGMMNRCGFTILNIEKTEGIVRNSLYMFPMLSIFLKFIKGPIVNLVMFIDSLTIPVLGESDIFIVAQKQ